MKLHLDKNSNKISNILSTNCELKGKWALIKTINITNVEPNKNNKTILEIKNNKITKKENDSIIYNYKLEKISDMFYKFNSGIHELYIGKECRELTIMYFEKEGHSETYKKIDCNSTKQKKYK